VKAVQRLGAILIVVPLAFMLGCGSGSTTGTTTTAGSESAAVNGLLQAIQSVEDAPTVASLTSAITQLSQALTAAESAASSSSSAANSALSQATMALSQAVTSLQKLAPKSSQSSSSSPSSSAPSPLQKPSAANSNAVKSILDDLNSGYTLLEKVLKDLGILPITSTTKAGQPSKKSPPTGNTFTLSVTRTFEGTVTASGTPGISCGIANDMCQASEQAGSTVGVTFSGQSGSTTYYFESVASNPINACDPGSVGTQTTSCDVTATAGVTVTLTPHWVVHQTTSK
jgi:hypothetical protein